jgi:ABC-type transporter Mla subunit MlaD
MTDKDIKQIGEEVERVLAPVYEEFGGIHKRLDRIENTLDAHTADIMQLQQQVGVLFDKTSVIDEKLTHAIKHFENEDTKIKKFVGMPVRSSD